MDKFDYLERQTADEYTKDMIVSLRLDYERCVEHKTQYPVTSKAKSTITNEEYDRLSDVNNMDDLIAVIGDSFVLSGFRCAVSGKTYPEVSVIYSINGISVFPFLLCRKVIEEWISD